MFRKNEAMSSCCATRLSLGTQWGTRLCTGICPWTYEDKFLYLKVKVKVMCKHFHIIFNLVCSSHCPDRNQDGVVVTGVYLGVEQYVPHLRDLSLGRSNWCLLVFLTSLTWVWVVVTGVYLDVERYVPHLRDLGLVVVLSSGCDL